MPAPQSTPADPPFGLGDTPPGFRSGFASIVGRPNVGKSTLLNQVLRRKVSIISSRAQTTRNAIRGVLTTDDAQIVFIDTPGLHKPRTVLGEKLNAVVHATLGEVDAVVFVLDAAQGIGKGDEYIASQLSEVAGSVVCVLNKVDRTDDPTLRRQMETAFSLGAFRTFVPVSAKVGVGVPDLLAELTDLMPPGPLYYPPDAVTDQPERMLVAELVREKLLEVTREEVPHSIAVVVEEMEARDEDLVAVDVVVYVERDSQKGIVIGRGGAVLREIGSRARTDIEGLLGSRVYLNVRVKVEKDWQKREMLVDRFGYGT